ncbi:MAG: TerD family protein [Alphaproteobacteria bacterium]|nr:TerD family protein [Alphaproteobacteria bacterium]
MPRLNKGEKTNLNVTQKARHRIMVGLSWDPAQTQGFMDKMREITGTPTAHDLDLVCYLYSPDHSFVEHISGDAGRNVDLSEKIYHSGDNVDGDAAGDDEEISAELKDLPPYISHLVFCALVRSGHKFGDVEAPEIRLADGYTNHNLLLTPINHAEGKDKNGFVFAMYTALPHRKQVGTYITCKTI